MITNPIMKKTMIKFNFLMNKNSLKP